MDTMTYTPTEDLSFNFDGAAEHFQCEMTCLPQEIEGITSIRIQFTAEQPTTPTTSTISWREPMDQIHFKWNPLCYEHRFLDISSGCQNSITTKSNYGAPVTCLHTISGENTITFALSDALHESTVGFRVNEDGTATCNVKLFCEPWSPIQIYSTILRIDRRPLSYHRCLRECAEWWDGLIPTEAISIPEGARTARYCSWYPFHGKFTGEDIERQCVLAKELGIGTFGYEAGWAETAPGNDNLDHEPDPDKYTDFRKHIDKIHSYGMKFVLWDAPSFTTPGTAERFKDKLLGNKFGENGNLDPRYPDVREDIISTYVRIVRDYDVDGLFLDFMPFFGTAQAAEPEDADRDLKSVAAAVDRLLHDLIVQLKQLNPDILMEFRQPYIGPHMRKYANMFRAVDCGNCFADNRIRTLDIRMLCGAAIAHADPIMWNTCEPVESAAMQLTHTLFSVPQVSMDLETLPADHTEMIRTYISFWNEHRDVILDGELNPIEPQSAYPLVLSSTQDKLLAALYSTAVIPTPHDLPATVLIVNGTYGDHVVVEAAGAFGKRRLTVISCTGVKVCDKEIELGAGLHRIDVPPNGYATLQAE
jgi:alpha-galactosidase